jgi:hypothetical protein
MAQHISGSAHFSLADVSLLTVSCVLRAWLVMLLHLSSLCARASLHVCCWGTQLLLTRILSQFEQLSGIWVDYWRCICCRRVVYCLGRYCSCYHFNNSGLRPSSFQDKGRLAQAKFDTISTTGMDCGCLPLLLYYHNYQRSRCVCAWMLAVDSIRLPREHSGEWAAPTPRIW